VCRYSDSDWQKVTPSNPSTEITPDEDIEWVADSASIEKLSIKFKNEKIFSNSKLSGNDTRKVKGKSKKDCWDSSDSYIIKAKPTGKGGFKEYDPEIKTPPKP
jgi:hypothetical protein